MKIKLTTVLLATVMTLGCATGGPNQTGGMMIGSLTGAAIGSQFGRGDGQLLGVAIGGLAGAMIGSHIGQQLDARDRQMMARSAQRTLEYQPDHHRSSWHNPNTRHRGTFEVTETHEMPRQNKVCRDFVQTVIIDGQHEKVTGRACRDVRDARGAWEIQR